MSLPLPIAALSRRARNAKSAKEQHDSAYFGWEASVRLSVAARPPADLSPLELPSIGHWVAALLAPPEPVTAAPLLEVFSLFSEIGQGKRSAPTSVDPRKLLDALPAYRNQLIGHGSTRTWEFYESAGQRLLEGLLAAWSDNLFLPRGSRLVYLERVDLDSAGGRRGRVVDLTGDAPVVENPRGTPGLPADLLPGRLFLRNQDGWTCLHPWLLYQEAELRERVLFFNGRTRSSQFLDYVGGEQLKGKQLAEAFERIEDDVRSLFQVRPSAPAEPEQENPNQFGDYRILGKLGEGGMGVVHLARQESLGRLVALKLLPPAASQDSVAVARFRREIAALSRCDHPNVVKILSSGEREGRQYYAMELIEGADLSQIARALPAAESFDAAVSYATETLRQAKADVFASVPHLTREAMPDSAGGPSGEAARYRKLATLFRDAARALGHLHAQGILHRDVKPANLMVTSGSHRLVLMDLGLAALDDASRALTQDRSAMLGTLRYMSPEQVQRGDFGLDVRADVYSLGATFYELLTDWPLFDGDSEAQLVDQVLHVEPMHPSRANRRLPKDLARILVKALQKDRALRYLSADALAADLDAHLEGRALDGASRSLAGRTGHAVRKNPFFRGAAVAAAVLGAAFLAYLAADSASHETAREELASARSARASEAAEALVAHARLSLDRGDLASAELFAVAALQRAERPDARGIVLEVAQGLRPTRQLGVRLLSECRRLTFDPEGALCATLGGVLLIDPSGGLEKRQFRLPGAGWVHQAAVSPDGTLLATATDDRLVRVLDLGTGQERSRFEPLPGAVYAVAFSPDGAEIASAGAFPQVRFFALGSGEPRAPLATDAAPVWSLAFSPDGRWLAAGGRNGKVHLWRLEAPERPQQLALGADEVRAVAFLRNGSLAAAASDGSVRLLSVGEGEVREQRSVELHLGPVLGLALSADGWVLATGGADRSVRLFGTEGFRPLLRLPDHDAAIRSVAIDPEGRIALAAGDRRFQVWRLSDPHPLSTRRLDSRVNGLASSPTGNALALALADGSTPVFREDGEVLTLIRDGEAPARSVAFLPEGRGLAGGFEDGKVRLYDSRGERALELAAGTKPVRAVAVSASGQWLAAASGGVAKLWELADPPKERAIDAEQRASSVALSSDGARLAISSEEGGVLLWNIAEAREEARLAGGGAAATSVAFSPDGSRLAVAGDDRIAYVWDVSSREARCQLVHRDRVSSIAFAAAGDLLASSSADGSVRLWAHLRCAEVARLEPHAGVSSALAFSANGTVLYTGGHDRLLRRYDLSLLETPAAELGTRAQRDFGLKLEGYRAAHLDGAP
ncbi:MAG: serine/threonine protein kinase [Myxococcales bacterium]|nr:serine/threonine protein kinase [Myxococcales bacterium]